MRTPNILPATMAEHSTTAPASHLCLTKSMTPPAVSGTPAVQKDACVAATRCATACISPTEP